MHEPPEAVLAAYLDTFRQAYKEVARDISRRIPDPKTAFRTLDALDAQLLALHHEQVTLMKAREVVRDREAEPGSLAQLGKRHNRSKARIAQYVEIAEQAGEEQACPS